MFGEFKPFSKIPRLYSQCRITEKIDGTNACVEVVGCGELGFAVAACSRTRRLVTVGLAMEPEWHQRDSRDRPVDNYGFGAWVVANAIELTKLGPGRHFGEWWGQGIQRTYGLADKRFSAFWRPETAPACVGQVPVLYEGEFHQQALLDTIGLLSSGSVAAPGFQRFEGVVVTFAAGPSFKVISNGDEEKRAG